MQLYLPALTGRLALFSDHVFMLESSSCSVEEASAEAQGQEPDKLEDAPLPCYEKRRAATKVLHSAQDRKPFTASGR